MYVFVCIFVYMYIFSIYECIALMTHLWRSNVEVKEHNQLLIFNFHLALSMVFLLFTGNMSHYVIHAILYILLSSTPNLSKEN